MSGCPILYSIARFTGIQIYLDQFFLLSCRLQGSIRVFFQSQSSQQPARVASPRFGVSLVCASFPTLTKCVVNLLGCDPVRTQRTLHSDPLPYVTSPIIRSPYLTSLFFSHLLAASSAWLLLPQPSSRDAPNDSWQQQHQWQWQWRWQPARSQAGQQAPHLSLREQQQGELAPRSDVQWGPCWHPTRGCCQRCTSAHTSARASGRKSRSLWRCQWQWQRKWKQWIQLCCASACLRFFHWP